MISTENNWVIDVQGLSKNFKKVKAVDNVFLKVKKGEIFGFLGANGSGKTTTIRMLCGLLSPDSGTGTCLGFDILTQADEIKNRVGYMTQKFSLYLDLSSYENLDFVARMYGIKNRKERIKEAFETFNFPEKHRTKLAGQLSEGWKQRLALVAVTLSKPQLLLLDEPTAGVDPKARRDFWEHIHRLSSEGVTTLVSTHYMDEAERCHRLAYLSNGKLLIEGTRDSVIAKSNLTTYEVKGDDLHTLSLQLQKLPAIEQVVPFGLSLHISGHNKEDMEQQLTPFKNNGHIWTLITPTLEDIFISYMQKNESDLS